MQLDAAASNLNSNDAFLLVTPNGTSLWMGAGASEAEKQGAQQLCDILGVSASELSEGGETGGWTAFYQKPNSTRINHDFSSHVFVLYESKIKFNQSLPLICTTVCSLERIAAYVVV